MARAPALRASDSDREEVADRLRQATVEGRLRTEELEDRLGEVFAARTYGELEALVADLPQPAPSPAIRSRGPAWVGGAAAATMLFAVLGSLVESDAHAHSPGVGRAVALLVAVAMGLALCAAAGWLYSHGASRLEQIERLGR